MIISNDRILELSRRGRGSVEACGRQCTDVKCGSTGGKWLLPLTVNISAVTILKLTSAPS